MQEVLTGNGRTATFVLALGLLALPARGIELGEIEVLSPLGEKLDARIPVRTRTGEWFHVTCIALAPASGATALPGIPGGTLSVERRRDSANLRLRSTEPVNDPALGFSIASTCAGAQQPPASREFSVLLDPPEVFARQRARVRTAPIARAPVSAPATNAEPAPRPATPAPPPAIAPRAAIAPSPARAPVSAPSQKPPSVREPAAPERVEAPAQAPAPKSEFVLRLTAAPIDIARTRQFDDKSRALLRERLRLLDADDQVSAMLAMRDSVRRLEARVAELQLKLDTTASIAEAQQARARAETTAPVAKPVPPKAEPVAPKVEAPVVAPPPPAKVEPPAPKVVAATATPAPAPKAEPPVPKVDVRPPAATTPSPRAAESARDFLSSLPGGTQAWALGLAAVVGLALLAWLVRRRRAAEPEEEFVEPDEVVATTMEPAHRAPELPPQTGALDREQAIEVAAPLRPEMGSDANLATRLEEDTEALRRRYIEERIPEIRDRTIVLDDPGSVVKGARLFYEDGAVPKAVELLHFAIEDRPAEMRPWLALFEIYRLERLTGEYSELAGRFRERHGATEQWAKVRGLGRELDPPNPLYQEPAAKPLETIGPREARRLAAGHVDPIAENWLEASMDFENEVHASELRRALMSRAKVEDRHLAPNPMPALRSVEMFSVG